MPRPISKKQFSDLWWEEFASHSEARGCIICGNSGAIDTLGKVFNALGEDCGGKAFCICPNGRAIKSAIEAARREAGA